MHEFETKSVILYENEGKQYGRKNSKQFTNITERYQNSHTRVAIKTKQSYNSIIWHQDAGKASTSSSFIANLTITIKGANSLFMIAPQTNS